MTPPRIIVYLLLLCLAVGSGYLIYAAGFAWSRAAGFVIPLIVIVLLFGEEKRPTPSPPPPPEEPSPPSGPPEGLSPPSRRLRQAPLDDESEYDARPEPPHR